MTNDGRRHVSERTATVTYYYLFDGLGSVVGMVDTSENLVAHYGYASYGQTVTKTGSAADEYQAATGCGQGAVTATCVKVISPPVCLPPAASRPNAPGASLSVIVMRVSRWPLALKA